jgi:hypothetical protein
LVNQKRKRHLVGVITDETIIYARFCDERMCENMKSICPVRLHANERIPPVKKVLESVEQKD